MISRFYAIVALLLLIGTSAYAGNIQHLKLSLAEKEIQIGPDGKASVKILVGIDKGWHTYGFELTDADGGSAPTEIAILPSKFIERAGPLTSSKPKREYDSSVGGTVYKHKLHADFTVPIRLKKGIGKGTYKASLEYLAMVCDTVRCLPPEADTLHFTVVVPDGVNLGATEDGAMGAATIDSAASVTASVDDKSATPGTPASGQAAVSKAPAEAVSGAQTESQKEIEAKKKEGLWAFFLFAMLQGGLALLTPCVFPMIPITVSFFTKRAEKQNNRWQGIRDSFIYSLGIIFTFVGIGVVVAAIYGGTGIGDIASNPAVNIAIALVFFLLALNLFGVYEIRVPSAILNSLNARSNQGNGVTSILLMGVVFTLTSFTCTVPFVSFVLGGVDKGDFLFPIVGMLGFSTVFATPFFVLALFPSAMAALPKAGGWMNNVKVVMGFLEIAFALKFISSVDLVLGWGILPREMFLGLWIACGLLIVLYILGLFHLPHDSKVQSVGAPRLLFAILFTGATFYLMSGLYGKALGEIDAYLPPQNYSELIESVRGGGAPAEPSTVKAQVTSGAPGGAPAGDAHANWIMSYEEGLRVAKETGKPIFIDFTGFFCTNCRWMEANIFPHNDVQALMNNMIKVQLYTDKRQEPYLSNKKLQVDRFGSLELPLYVILKPDGELIASKAFTRNKQEFIAFLKKAG